jgi:hypothetical protein
MLSYTSLTVFCFATMCSFGIKGLCLSQHPDKDIKRVLGPTEEEKRGWRLTVSFLWLTRTENILFEFDLCSWTALLRLAC